MDIKTLLDNLHNEVSCSVCICTFTDPKQLPCLHSFCLHCLNELQRTSGLHGQITCPECGKQFRIPGSGNPCELQTNFRINSLLDVLAIKQCNATGVKCGNCDKRSAQSLYCFQCCAFWCEDCITGHNIIRANKDHRALSLKDFGDQDIEDVLKRPASCQKKHHDKEELKFFCKDCKVAICNAFALTDHEDHAKVILEDAANERKERLNSAIQSLKEKALQKRTEIGKLEHNSIDVLLQVADVKSKVQTSADHMIAIIEARKQDIFNAVDNQAKESLDRLALRKGEVENQVKMIESAIEETETVLKRSSSAEILGFNQTFDIFLQEQGAQGNRDPERITRFSFIESEKLLNMLNTEGIGTVKTDFSKTKAQQSNVQRKGNSDEIAEFELGGNVHGSPFEVQVETRRFRPVLSIGKYGSSVRMLDEPCGIAVNERNEIAVSELGTDRVSVFSSDGTHLRSFGREGGNQGEFNSPSGIAFDNNGNIIVADCGNHRVQVFSGNGEFLNKFGGKGSLDHQLNEPEGLSVTRNGDNIVADQLNKLIKIFSPGGQFLRKFGEGFLAKPYHCIQTEQYFIVSDLGDHCMKVFDLEGNFQFKFGKKGNKEGEFHEPCYLSVNKEGRLIVCDSENQRIQVFELSGKFATKFGKKGSKTGEFDCPVSTANLSDGRLVVSDYGNHRIQIFELI